jgi:hypothetical protein
LQSEQSLIAIESKGVRGVHVEFNVALLGAQPSILDHLIEHNA